MIDDKDPRRPNFQDAKQRVLTGYLLAVIAALGTLLAILLVQRYVG